MGPILIGRILFMKWLRLVEKKHSIRLNSYILPNKYLVLAFDKLRPGYLVLICYPCLLFRRNTLILLFFELAFE